ncbi:MAG: exodeoxyribonuclease VII large subunit [Anaerolineaceae bacterium]|nr:exodeoxyribonuclease VII large subunit [Anaerolineaceae bacterium]
MDSMPRPLMISELTRYLRELFSQDLLLQDVWVQGEISNFTRASSGHIYLTLKDANSALRCVIWRTQAARIAVPLQNGMAVEAHGALNVYERDGSYQLYIDVVRPGGQGDLYQEFMRMKARLEAEGLFDPARKRQLPAFPRRIGLVTSPTGAALQDMLNILRRRYPSVEVILSPSAVQGAEAPVEIIKALLALQHLAVPPDVILVARGGGSLEDLWAFNDEWVVRAIAGCAVPVISGVGHETDFTLADFAADLRAPTPTAAAALAVPDRLELQAALGQTRHRLQNALQATLAQQQGNLQAARARLERFSPVWRLRSERQRLDNLTGRGWQAIGHQLSILRADWRTAQERLNALNPLAVLSRGYAVVQRSDGSLVTRAAQATPGEDLAIHFADGKANVQVQYLEIDKEEGKDA